MKKNFFYVVYIDLHVCLDGGLLCNNPEAISLQTIAMQDDE